MKNIFIKKEKIKKQGFTLVETLVAIGILSLSILGAFTAVQSGLHSSTIAKDQITAFYLTQEVMEYIRNIRDENALHALDGTSVSWLHNLAESSGDACNFGSTCTIDSPLKVTARCSGGFGTCPVLRQDPASGLYGYTGSWTATNIKREVQLTSISSNEIQITVRMSWTSGAFSQSFQVTESMFNHQ
jgi:prepilin-type N-terminal cleavage/methylation domain-containing protein